MRVKVRSLEVVSVGDLGSPSEVPKLAGKIKSMRREGHKDEFIRPYLMNYVIWQWVTNGDGMPDDATLDQAFKLADAKPRMPIPWGLFIGIAAVAFVVTRDR